MSTGIRLHSGFATPLRVLFGLIAVLVFGRTLLGSQPDAWATLTGYAGSVMWAALAVFGGGSGWTRVLAWASVIVYGILVAGGLIR